MSSEVVAGAPAATAGQTRSHALATLFAWIARLFVALVFIYAAAIKIDDPAAFARDIRGYEMFPATLTNIMAYTIPWLELSTAALLVFGLWRLEARLLLIAMLVAFTVLKVVALQMGHNLDCGCFGESWLATLSRGWNGVYLNLAMLAALGLEWLADLRRRPALRTPATPAAQPAQADS